MKIGVLSSMLVIKVVMLCFFADFFLTTTSYGQVYYPGVTPGKALIVQGKGKISLSNKVLNIIFSIPDGQLKSIYFHDKENGNKYQFDRNNLLSVVLNDGDSLTLNDFSLDSVISSQQGKDRNGFFVKSGVILSSKVYGIRLSWMVKLNDQANYVSHQFDILSDQGRIKKIYPLHIPLHYRPEVIGLVDGSPVFSGNTFWAIEDPMFKVEQGEKACHLYLSAREKGPGTPHAYQLSMAWGCTPAGQLRRGFLYYLEKTRAVPYRPLTFYDSWYDLSYDLNVLTEENCIDRIKTWGDSLKRRGVGLDCFLWDSGWDDWYNMWEFNKELPEGFRNINAVAQKYHASSGAWISPWGGYDEFIKIRLATAEEHFPQYKINEHGFTLTDPNYYTYFKDVIVRLIRENNATLFKIDGIDPGKYNPDCSGFGIYEDEMHAFITLIESLRKVKPDLRLNLTVGTWPSPFWLCYGDNIWKGGDDFGFVGEGNRRQQWMNYRDYGVYKCMKKSPLCPVSSLMFHGITIANYGATADYEMDDRFVSDDIWTFFSNGTSLQELYINPHKLNENNWDELARAIKWSRKHRNALVDSHWVGGNPSEGEVYGFASWNPSDATLMLRNPSSRSTDFSFRLDDLLELPSKYEGTYRLMNVRTENPEGVVKSKKEATIHLAPFEVKVMNVTMD
jgi:hypothetical protein